MRLPCSSRLLLCLTALALVLPLSAIAQDDPNELPLGDVARSLRQKAPPPAAMPVINDDNLPQIMESTDHGRSFRSSWPFLLMADTKLHDPDVTCSLSFTVNVKSLISRQYDQMELPPADLAKIDAKALIEGDTLTIPVFNGTEWHLSEISIAFTVVKKMRGGSGTMDAAGDPFEQVRPEKKPDRTVIYRVRAAGAPWDRTVFSTPLNLDLGPDDEWHWAIVQVKGYPPQIPVDQVTTSSAAPSHAQSLPTALEAPVDGESSRQNPQ